MRENKKDHSGYKDMLTGYIKRNENSNTIVDGSLLEEFITKVIYSEGF